MALTQQEADARDALLAELDGIDRDIDTAFAAATTHNAELQTQIDTLNATIGDLRAAGNASAAQITDLTNAAAALQASLDSQSSDVVAALQGVGNRIGTTDAHIMSLGGTP